METDHAVLVFSALSQPTRLEVFRLLIENEPAGLPAGEVARRMAVPHNTMSTHLAILTRAGLITAERQSRSIVYRARLDAVRELAGYLVQDCCGGRPEICAPLIADLSPCCPPRSRKEDRREGDRPWLSGHAMDYVIYHNPACGTSRNVLGLIRNAGIEPQVIEYLKTPPSRTLLAQLIERMGCSGAVGLAGEGHALCRARSR